MTVPQRPIRGAFALATVFLLGTVPVPAQDQPNARVEEFRRQLQAERAARKSLTYQEDMRKAARLAEAGDWRALRARPRQLPARRGRLRSAGMGMAFPVRGRPQGAAGRD